ncbi:MAG: NUDIX hydrolase [Xylanivirga thermophila]|uniref:NUDIX hydrolase n=1 Tax=Xylanivirga thermophila TaxID=2496273 RepID=UPI0039F556C2
MKIISKEKVYKGPIFDVYHDKVLLENGRTTYRDAVKHHPAAAIAAIDDEGYILMVEQYRYPIGQKLLELPAGLVDPGEQPSDAAKRELWEETGYEAKSWRELGSFFSSPGGHDEKIFLYLATDIEKVSKQHLDKNEILTFRRVKFEDVLSMVRNGQILDGKTIIAVLIIESLKLC